MINNFVPRKRRVIGRPGSCYHVISRFVDRKFAMNDHRSKRVFRDIMLRQSEFSGVEILTYCLMGNHFHILVRVPERPELPEGEVLRRVALIWSPKRMKRFRKTLERHRKNKAQGKVDALLERQRRRMYRLDEFVKDIKQRFSVWYNYHHERRGTLFEERYKSVLVETGQALRFMAAYIELNPVRAGLVQDPGAQKENSGPPPNPGGKPSAATASGSSNAVWKPNTATDVKRNRD